MRPDPIDLYFHRVLSNMTPRFGAESKNIMSFCPIIRDLLGWLGNFEGSIRRALVLSSFNCSLLYNVHCLTSETQVCMAVRTELLSSSPFFFHSFLSMHFVVSGGLVLVHLHRGGQLVNATDLLTQLGLTLRPNGGPDVYIGLMYPTFLPPALIIRVFE